MPEWTIGWSEDAHHPCNDKKKTGAICSPYGLPFIRKYRIVSEELISVYVYVAHLFESDAADG